MHSEKTVHRLVVGLGNPGVRYQNTWHNLGSRTVEEISRRQNLAFKPGKGEYFYSQYRQPNCLMTLMIPTGYMNRSGLPVAEWMRYYRIPVEELLVILDDHDLPLGRIRIRAGGSAGGHRGLEDIIIKLNSSDFPRIRIGINVDKERINLSDQVLSKIPNRYRDDVDHIIVTAADAVEMIEEKGLTKAMNHYNTLNFLQPKE